MTNHEDGIGASIWAQTNRLASLNGHGKGLLGLFTTGSFCIVLFFSVWTSDHSELYENICRIIPLCEMAQGFTTCGIWIISFNVGAVILYRRLVREASHTGPLGMVDWTPSW
jgi:hypothetical protein